jgi:UDP-GlcNAc:undecaprenyl-phosphate GlcNAc-1-phosphate transferase
LSGLTGGVPVVSVLLTTVWIVAVTNAMNFIDNMDGLSGGVGAIAAAGLTAAALLSGQWFVAALSAAVCGACLGFLTQNYPRARMFMGDGGSLVLGFLLAFLATRITYILPGVDPVTDGGPAGVPWYAVLMPVCVLAVPLYDFASVTGIRVSQGKSPFKGDLQHLSHRLVKRGLSKPVAVAVIWGFAVLTGLNGLLLVRAEPWEAVLHGVMLIVLMGVMAAVEFGTASRAGGDEMLRA